MSRSLPSASRLAALLSVPFALALVTSAQADIRVVAEKCRIVQRLNPADREYRCRITAQNNGAMATGVTAVATSYSDQITVVQGNLTFPDLPPGATAKSTNVLLIRKPKALIVDQPKALHPNGLLLRIDFSATSTPVANAGADQVREVGALALLNGRGSYDPFGKPLTYQWTLQSAPAGSVATIVDADQVLARLTPDVAGDYVVRFTVSNGTHTSAPSTTTISTTAVRPVADAGPDQIIKRRSTVQLDGSASTNAMERPLTYSWQILKAPNKSLATLSDPTALRPTFVADRRGTYRIQLVVSDGVRSSAPSVVTIRRGLRRANTPARADAGSDISSFGPTLPVILQGGRATDVDGDFLTYRWFVLGRPAGSTAAPAPNDPHPIFRLDGAGAWHLQVNVSDGQSESIATVLVNTENDVAPPTAGYAAPDDSDPSVFVLAGDGRSNYRNLNGDPGSLERIWTLLSRPPGSAATLVGAELHTDVDGDYAAQMKATDEGSITALQTLGITRGAARPVAVVDSAPWSPLAGSAIHFIDWVPDLEVTLDGSNSFDQNGLPLTYRWTLLHRPPTSKAAFDDPTIASPKIVLDVDGRYVAQLVVNNGTSDSLPVTTTLVNYVNQAPVAMDVLTSGPQESPCIPIELRGMDEESCPTTFAPGVVFRRINSTVNGALVDFVPANNEGEETLCYRPRRFFTGTDQFSYEAYDAGFPWMCGDEAPGCRQNKTGPPAFGNIQILEVP